MEGKTFYRSLSRPDAYPPARGGLAPRLGILLTAIAITYAPAVNAIQAPDNRFDTIADKLIECDSSTGDLPLKECALDDERSVRVGQLSTWMIVTDESLISSHDNDSSETAYTDETSQRSILLEQPLLISDPTTNTISISEQFPYAYVIAKSRHTGHWYGVAYDQLDISVQNSLAQDVTLHGAHRLDKAVIPTIP